jgi:dipeptidase E
MIASHSFKLSSKTLEHQGILSETDYDNLGPIGESSAKTFGFVGFDIKPHLNSSVHSSTRNEEYVREIAKRLDTIVYALDDQSAIKIIGDKIEVISEGSWLLLND